MESGLSLRGSRPGSQGIEEIEDACDLALTEWGLMRRRAPFLFAIREALNNADAANRRGGHPNAFLEVRLICSEEAVIAEIPDFGSGLPPQWRETLLTQDMGELLCKERGRGLLFMDKLCDELDSARDSSGLHVVILKVRRMTDA